MTSVPPNPGARPAAAEAALLAILLVSIHGFVVLPFAKPIGIDFLNLWAFHHCEWANSPYAVGGDVCNDPGGREMVYPPPLYWAFAWVRPLGVEAAMVVWSAVVALGTAAALLAFAPAARWRTDGRLGLFAGLLLAQFPFLYALERLNNDVLVVLCWAGALLAWRSGRAALAGAVLALSVLLKVYPAFGAISIAAAVAAGALRDPGRRRAALAFAAGAAGTAAAVAAALAGQFRTWATVRLPPFAAFMPVPHLSNHSPYFLLREPWPLQAVALLAWIVAAVRVLHRDPALAFAGALAITTFFTRTSMDYNLITTFPLLVVLYQRAAEGRWRPAADAVLAAGLAAVIGDRFLLALDDAWLLPRNALLWAWLVASAALAPALAARGGERPGDAVPAEAAAP